MLLVCACTFVTGSTPGMTSDKRMSDGKTAGDVRDDNSLETKFVWCLLGTVTMERYAHDEDGREKITPVSALLTRGFWLGKYEVTQKEWKQVMGTKPWDGQPNVSQGDGFPATHVNWDDATEFCRRLTEREKTAGWLPDGWEYGLPTAAQWLRACQAGNATAFSFGDDESKLGDYAWYEANAKNAGEAYAHRVGQKQANAWGLHDMHGNVMEWCRDFHTDPPGGRDPEAKITMATTGALVYRVSPGGNWRGEAWRCRSARNAGSVHTSRSEAIGFRVALTANSPRVNPAVKSSDGTP